MPYKVQSSEKLRKSSALFGQGELSLNFRKIFSNQLLYRGFVMAGGQAAFWDQSASKPVLQLVRKLLYIKTVASV